MNREEFNELQSEFAEYIYRYEYFLKTGYLNDFYYNLKFQDDIATNSKIEYENSVMLTAINESKAKPEFNLNEFLEFVKGNKKDLEANVEDKIKRAKLITGNTDRLSVDEKKDFEKLYLETIKKYHPVVRVFVDENEKKIFETLRSFYNDNNVGGFKEFLDLNKDNFKPIDYAEDTFSKVAGFYYQNQKNINADFTKKSGTYPFNKREVFKDDISISREGGEFKVNYTRLLRDNQNLKLQYKQLFGVDLDI